MHTRSWLGVLGISVLGLACGSDDVQPVGTSGATSTGGATSTPDDGNTGPLTTAAQSSDDGNQTMTGAEGSETSEPPLSECRGGQGTICYEIPSALCECPEGLTCVGDVIGHVRDCQPCDCPPDHTCYSDAVGGYTCVPDLGTTGEASTGDFSTGSTG